MPWTEPAYVATGDVMTASQWNSQVVDNLKHIADKGSRNAVVALKPKGERPRALPKTSEAGTPWWH